MGKQNFIFRTWFYFRNGWSMYFAFIMAAVNTLTVTYYLAIEKYPILHTIFPTFLQYTFTVVIIGIPALVLIGYIHYKKTAGYRSEIDVTMETNPYWVRILANSEMNLTLNLRFLELLEKLSKNSEISDIEFKELEEIKSNYINLMKERSFSNKKDLEYLRQIHSEFEKKPADK